MGATMRTYSGSFRVRSYECDMFGHVNNAVYQQYLEQATIDAFAEQGQTIEPGRTRQIQQISIEYLRPAVAGNNLTVSVWASSCESQTIQFGYELRRETD